MSIPRMSPTVLAAVVLAAALLPAFPASAYKIATDPFVGAIVVDASSGAVLRETNANRPAYPASMVKLMDAYLVLEAVSSGRIHLDDLVRVTPEASRIGGSQVWLDPKESFTIDQLLYAIMVRSANDAAVLLASYVEGSVSAFVDAMNAKARELGLSSVTHFVSPNGLPVKAGNTPDITTPADMAKLCVALLRDHPEILRYSSTSRYDFRPTPHSAQIETVLDNTNPLLASMPGECDGLKTGYYADAGFSIAVTGQRNGARAVAVIMGCAAKATRNSAATEWLSYGLAHAIPPPPQPEPAPVAVVPPPPVPGIPASIGPSSPDSSDVSPSTDGPDSTDKPSPSHPIRTTLLTILSLAVVGIVVLALRRRRSVSSYYVKR